VSYIHVDHEVPPYTEWCTKNRPAVS